RPADAVAESLTWETSGGLPVVEMTAAVCFDRRLPSCPAGRRRLRNSDSGTRRRGKQAAPPIRIDPFPMSEAPWYVVRQSSIHNRGVFAARDIPEGTRIIEYLGERITK